MNVPLAITQDHNCLSRDKQHLATDNKNNKQRASTCRYFAEANGFYFQDKTKGNWMTLVVMDLSMTVIRTNIVNLCHGIYFDFDGR